MGKTEKGAIWLNKDQLSPYDYWQFWRNTDDRDVKNFFIFLQRLKQMRLRIFLIMKKILII